MSKENNDSLSDSSQETHRFHLLKSLRNTVEWLLSSCSSNVWKIYGSLSRLESILDEILSHGLRYQGTTKYWPVVSHLPKIHEEFTESSNTNPQISEHLLLKAWLQKSLIEHNLTNQLQSLLENPSHISYYYTDWAFVNNHLCTKGLLTCLQAVELNQPMLLTDIDVNPVTSPFITKSLPSLNIVKQGNCDTEKKMVVAKIDRNNFKPPSETGARSKVFKSSPKHRKSWKNQSSTQNHRNVQSAVLDSEFAQIASENENKKETRRSSVSLSKELCTISRGKLNEKSLSLDDITLHSSKVRCSSTIVYRSDFGDYQEIQKKSRHSRSKSDVTEMIRKSEPHSAESLVVRLSSCSSLPMIEQERKKSIFEGPPVNAPTECFFPRPQPGQSLTSFLTSNDFNICAELDRENAHFCISEALIAAMEQIKCSKNLKFVEDEAESDEEIKKLTQRIRIRRKEKIQEKCSMKNLTLLSDGKTDTTTSISVSPRSSYSSDFDPAESIGSEDDIDDVELSESAETSNLTSMKESGLSLSMASMYSDADLQKMNFAVPSTSSDTQDNRQPMLNNSQMSAESVALSLLRRFSEKQLPKASELEWLISEKDVDQKLLPLPNSWPVSPDTIEEEYALENTRLRGNLEWAPPRRQIIFIIHPCPNRKRTIAKQNCRCAGCGMKIDQSQAKKFRYCEYLGKFFCQCCHCNNTSLIPARILWKWDFKKYYISKFTFSVLDQMFYDPLFNVSDINNNLYRRVKQLDTCRELRSKMFFLKDFMKTCRNAKHIQKEIDDYPSHVFSEPHLYSINDFVLVKNGDLSKQLQYLVAKCNDHVLKCVLCNAKGFICELCNNSNSVIFSFQTNKVHVCNDCGCCFHRKCFKLGICPKCIRIKERKKLQQQKTYISSDDEL